MFVDGVVGESASCLRAWTGCPLPWSLTPRDSRQTRRNAVGTRLAKATFGPGGSLYVHDNLERFTTSTISGFGPEPWLTRMATASRNPSSGVSPCEHAAGIA
jgi:hypothetical protein